MKKIRSRRVATICWAISALIIGCAGPSETPDTLAFRQSRSAKTSAALRSFLAQYPASVHRREAESMLLELDTADAFRAAAQIGTEAALNDFEARFPQSSFTAVLGRFRANSATREKEKTLIGAAGASGPVSIGFKKPVSMNLPTDNISAFGSLKELQKEPVRLLAEVRFEPTYPGDTLLQARYSVRGTPDPKAAQIWHYGNINTEGPDRHELGLTLSQPGLAAVGIDAANPWPGIPATAPGSVHRYFGSVFVAPMMFAGRMEHLNARTLNFDPRVCAIISTDQEWLAFLVTESGYRYLSGRGYVLYADGTEKRFGEPRKN